jgi:hypothetical protein
MMQISTHAQALVDDFVRKTQIPWYMDSDLGKLSQMHGLIYDISSSTGDTDNCYNQYCKWWHALDRIKVAFGGEIAMALSEILNLSETIGAK